MPPHSDRKRSEQLLDGLTEIVLSEGFIGLRIGALANTLHCSRSTLYKLAPSKEALVLLVCERYINGAIDEAVARSGQYQSARDKLFHYSSVVAARRLRGSDQFWRDFNETPDTAEVLSWASCRGRREIERLLKVGVESGEFRAMHTGYIAFLIWSAAAAARNPGILAEFGLNQATGLEELTRLVVDGIGSDTPH